MNYIYDIVLNFQKYYCDFFEWRREDKISNVRKIALYRVKEDDLKYFKYFDVVVDSDFFNKVKDSCGTNKKYMCLVSDGNFGMGLLFNENGKIIKRSSMIYDEEDEVCGYVMDLDNIDINYERKRDIPVSDELRFFKQRRNFLFNYLKHIDNDVLWKYLYYECYGKDETNLDIIKENLFEVVKKGYSEVNKRLYNSVISISKIKN